MNKSNEIVRYIINNNIIESVNLKKINKKVIKYYNYKQNLQSTKLLESCKTKVKISTILIVITGLDNT